MKKTSPLFLYVKNHTLFIMLALSVCAIAPRAAAQCETPIRITIKNIEQITDPYQLTFIHEVPKNKVDTLVAMLLKPNGKALYDEAAIIESLAATRTRAAFQLLYTACLRPQVFDDLNPFATLSAKIVHYGGHRLLNRYFLNGAVKAANYRDSLNPDFAFQRDVMKYCTAKKPDARFCPVRNKAYTVTQMQHEIDEAFSEYQPCTLPIPVTENNIYAVHNPYEFTFLHRNPQNLTDSVVHMLRFGPLNAESPLFLEKMAKSKSRETFLFLYACCAVDDKKEISTNLFHNIANQVNIWGGFRHLNQNFLDSVVPENLPEADFRKQVLKHARSKNPVLFYCHQPTIAELYAAHTADVDPGPYDKQIVKIIRKYDNTNKHDCAKNITGEVLQLPFVEDVLWDGCYEKLSIYPEYYYLMVVMNIGDKKVERYYKMNGARFRYFGVRFGKKCSFGRTIETNPNKLTLTGLGYSPGALDAARAYCEQKKKASER